MVEKSKVRQRKKSEPSEQGTDNKDVVPNSEEAAKPRKTNSPGSRLKSYRIWTRLVILLAVFIIAYFTSNKDKERKFALRRESIILRAQNVECATDYLNEISQFTTCIPNKCGRFVSDSLVTEKEATTLLSLMKRAAEYGGGNGGVTILDVHTGTLSKDSGFVNIHKLVNTNEFVGEAEVSTYEIIRKKIAKAIADKFAIEQSAFYPTRPTFISRIDNTTAKTIHDKYWMPHVDKETYSAFHYTGLLYLNDFKRDFEGGRFMFVDENKEDNRTMYSSVEPKKGRVVVFTSGAENLHHIEKVTKGTRFAMTISFTCNYEHAVIGPDQQFLRAQ